MNNDPIENSKVIVVKGKLVWYPANCWSINIRKGDLSGDWGENKLAHMMKHKKNKKNTIKHTNKQTNNELAKQENTPWPARSLLETALSLQRALPGSFAFLLNVPKPFPLSLSFPFSLALAPLLLPVDEDGAGLHEFRGQLLGVDGARGTH